MPTISGSAAPGSATGGPRGLPGGGAGPELISSVSFNPLSLQALDRQRLGHGRRCLIDRRNSQDRGDALDDAAGRRRRGPAGVRKTEALLVTVRLIDQRQYQITRIVHRKHADEIRQKLLFLIMPALVLLRRAGLPADDITWRRGQFRGAELDDEAHQLAHLLRGLFRDDPLARWLRARRQFVQGRKRP